MPTRFNTKSKSKYGSPPLRSGYENQNGVPDFTIPSCGIEDVDVGIFNLFDKEIKPECGGIEGAPLAKVPVIFAAGEKWAMLKRGRPVRDKNNTLIIPLITIMRQEIEQSLQDDVTGRGINQQVGEFVIKRRLDKSDRSYQNLINKLLIKNQSGAMMPEDGAHYADQSVSSNSLGEKTSDPDIGDASALLKPISIGKNVYETIVVPTPQFYTAVYKVTVWTQYMQHANQIMEKIITSYLPQGQSWRIDTPKGYWFVGKVDDSGFELETNMEDMSAEERFIKHNFTVKVPAYFFASKTPGTPIPLKRYVSSPDVSFDTVSASDIFDRTQYTVGSDDPTLPLESQHAGSADVVPEIDPITGVASSIASRSPRYGGLPGVYSPRSSNPTSGGNGNSTKGNSTPRSWKRSSVYPVNTAQDLDDPANSSLPRGRNVTVTEHVQGERTYRGLPLSDFEIVIDKL